MKKKAFEESRLLLKLPHKKGLRRMKATTFFFIFFAIGLFATESHSQVSKISLDAVNTSARDVLREIERQTDYLFIFNPNEIDLNKKTSLQINNKMVAEVLSEIFRQTDVTYAMEGNNIMLMKRSEEPRQNKRQIAGTVVDAHGEPVIGANVIERGTTNGVITDLDGRFSLQVEENVFLQISYIGYVAHEISVGNQSMFTITLQEDHQALEEVVVVGYGIQKKSVVTGAISSVKSDDFRNMAITNSEQALQGKTSGVQVISSSGAPGAAMKIRIRGYGSNGTSDPLYIVDGLRTDNISGLDPSNIAGMEVLKDAASAAIYGAEGGNGVVLITTKSGTKGVAKISYDFQYAIQSATRLPKLMNAEQYIGYQTEAGNLVTGIASEYDTDWLGSLFEASPMQKHTLSFSGANDIGDYYLSLGYLNHDGIIKGNNDRYERFSAMFNGSYKLRSWMKVGSNFSISYSDRRSVTENDFTSVVGSALSLDPLTPIEYTETVPAHVQSTIDRGKKLIQSSAGNYYGVSSYVTGSINPFIQRDISNNKSIMNSLMGNIYTDITPFDGFTFTSKLGINYMGINRTTYSPEYYYNVQSYNDYATVNEVAPVMHYWQWENYASYMKSIGDHNFVFMLGTAVSERRFKYVSASGSPLTQDQESFADLDYIASQERSVVGGTTHMDRKLSYFGRASYDYKGIYLAQVSLRRDAAGLSILPKNERWGTFPAASVGWVLTNEDFFSATLLSYLKIRASWGQNGSVSNLRNYQYASNISNSTMYPMGDGSYVTGSKPEQLSNPNLKWETSEQLDFGLDVRAFNDRLTFTADYFDKKTKDLITMNTPPLEAGNTASPINGGNVSNKGFEFELGWRDKVGSLNYSVKANLATLKNEVTYLNPSIARLNGAQLQEWYATAFEKGMPIWYFRGYKTDGVDPETGDIIFKDVNNDGVINEDDKTMIGSGIPDFTYGATINLEYKAFDFTLFATGQSGNEVLMGLFRTDRPTVNRFAFYYIDRWTPGNTSASLPRADVDTRYWFSDGVVFDGSFLKIKQIQLGYSFPKSFLNKITFSGARIYVSLEDFFTISDYPGIDPEASASNVHSVRVGSESSGENSIGIDRGYYPMSRKVLFGLSVTF